MPDATRYGLTESNANARMNEAASASVRPARVVIERLSPEIDAGRYPIKRVVGEAVVVEIDAFADGHDELRAVLLHRRAGTGAWAETEMRPLINDRWQAEFRVESIGRYEYSAGAWIDRFRTWHRDMMRRIAAGQRDRVDLLIGARIVEEAAARATGTDAIALINIATALQARDTERALAVLEDDALALIERYSERSNLATHPRVCEVVVDPPYAGFSTWYEMFPRSASPDPSRTGSLRDMIARLPYVRSMGFDVLYMPPLHPIGRTYRKGKNNAVEAAPDDVGSPWAIGGSEGGHTAISPELGTMDDVRALIAAAGDHGIRIALDIAFQTSPDHPYVREHPEWFRQRPDGSIQYAENPPKKYQDIYPFDFETASWQALWNELRDVMRFWIDEGIRIFRVDNPHTKPFRFWEWLIDEIKREHPDVIFLSEAFTRPKVMQHLAKSGFSQSYTYFAWRNTNWELRTYFEELTQTDVREYLRPNLWPNTPDILPEYLQTGGRPAFQARLVLAATLGANYGIYGPVFELMEHEPREFGSEEYLHSEKYEVRHWDLDRPDSLAELIGRVNRIRRQHPALQSDRSLRFHHTDNEQLLCYSKRDGDDVIVTVVNLDPHFEQSGWLYLTPEDAGLASYQPYQVHDLLSEARYLWEGDRHFVQLNPHAMPAHIFAVRKRLRSEQEFEYYQ